QMAMAAEGEVIVTDSVEDLVAATLVTAPELGAVESYSAEEPATRRFIRKNGLFDATTNSHPRFFEMRGDTPQQPVRYMMVLPTGQVSVGDDDTFMPEPVVEPFGQYKHHLKVSVYDLTDTEHLDV